MELEDESWIVEIDRLPTTPEDRRGLLNRHPVIEVRSLESEEEAMALAEYIVEKLNDPAARFLYRLRTGKELLLPNT